MQETFCVYVLYSDKFNKIYVGQTHDLINRMKAHNVFEKNSFASKYRPWKVIYVEFFDSRKEALVREKALKSGKGREWIKKGDFF